jgi:hypothetical protein
MIRLVALIVAIASLSQAHATYTTGQITGYGPGTANGKYLVVFKLVGQATSGCNTTARFAINSDSLHFQGALSAIVAAFHSQTPVTVSYEATCNKLDNAFDVNFVCVGDINC